MKKNNILIISFYMYPCKLVGAKRMSYIANYLADKGIEVTVLKVEDESYDNQIDKNLKLDARIRVIEVKKLNKYKTFRQSIYRFFRYKKTLCSLLEKEDFDVLYFSGGPFFYFPLGIYSRFKYKIPYILDFRDLWIIGKKVKLNWKGNLLSNFEKYFERVSIKNASMVICVTPKTTELFKQEFNNPMCMNFVTIMNGYNDLELPEIISSSTIKRDPINIGIFGKFSYYDLNHIDILIKSIRNSEIEIKIHHIGHYEEDFVNYVELNKLSKNFVFVGYKNYTEGIMYLSNMDYLILNNRSEYALGTKIFDYLYLNKPVLAFMTPSSEIWNLLSNFKNTFLIQNSFDLISAIQELMCSDDLNVIQKQDLFQYSRQHQTEILYEKIIMLINRK
ncbi:MAG: glycosyltransferase [Candidatus Cloacimonadales bacterium]|nr:glycosyltransferase [Candidatus Cloacimonadales bacterium]